MSTTSTKRKGQVSQQKERRVFPAKVKCEAVLAVWTERRKPSEICRELGINWASLNGWQNRALGAMLSALEPRMSKEEERGPALGPKLERLLERTSLRAGKISKLEQRLAKIQTQKAEPAK